MGERPDRPDELRRDPLGRPDPLGEEGERGVDPADAREVELEPPPPPFNPETASPDPALAGGRGATRWRRTASRSSAPAPT
jgi:hypothetical protein